MASGGSNTTNIDFPDYFTKEFHKVQDIELEQCFKLAVINNHIWAPVCTGDISVYNMAGQVVDTVHIKAPLSVTQANNGDIFIGCHTISGLHVMSENGAPQKLCEGSFADVYTYGSKVYALQYEEGKLLVEYLHSGNADDVHQRWKSGRKWQTEATSLHDKLIVTSQDGELTFFISHLMKHKVCQYNGQGQCMKEYGGIDELGQGEVIFLWLCSIDMHSRLLVADEGHCLYKILDMRPGEVISTKVTGRNKICDAKIDEGGNLWLCQYNGAYVISKYQAK